MEAHPVSTSNRSATTELQQLNIARLQRSYKATRIWMILIGMLFGLLGLLILAFGILGLFLGKEGAIVILLPAVLVAAVWLGLASQLFGFSQTLKRFLESPSLSEHRNLINSSHRVWRNLGFFCFLFTLLFAAWGILMYIGLFLAPS